MEIYDTYDFIDDNGYRFWAEKSGEPEIESTFESVCEYIDLIRDYQESQI